MTMKPKRLVGGQNVWEWTDPKCSATPSTATSFGLRAEEDIEAWIRKPLSTDENSLAEISDWGPAEDWTDRADAAG